MYKKYAPEQLNRKAIIKYTLTDLKNAIKNGDILESPVIKCDEDLTLYIDIGAGILGKIKFTELEYSDKPVKTVAAISKVGKTVRYKVVNINKNDETVECELSRKEAQKDCYENYIKNLKVGQVISAVVISIEKYGLFCDIGNGIVALLPTNNISMAHIRNPKHDLNGVKKIKVIISNIDENGKITLSHKELLGTWEHEAAKFKDGDTVAAVVREVKDYGVFVELTPNLVGLADNYPDLEENDLVSVFIKGRSPEKMKFRLIITNKIGPRTGDIYYNYILPEDGMVKDWVYSPEGAEKKIETHFE